MPTPEELQVFILTGPEADACAPYVHTNDMPKISGVEARAKDQAIADILNAKTTPGLRAVPLRDLSANLFASGAMESIQTAVMQGNPAAALVDRLFAVAISHGLTHADPSYAAKLDALAGAGAMSTEHATQAKALFECQLSTAEVEWGEGTTITRDAVGIALRNVEG